MSQIRSSVENRASYENFEVRCPHCGGWIVFNRASDLKTLQPIAGREVNCLVKTCGKPIWLTDDRIDPAFEMFLTESEEFWSEKRYMQCVLTSVQAYELFFAAVVRTWLLYRPFPNQRRLDLFNELSTRLYEKTRSYPFVHMRNLLFCIVIERMQPADLDEARSIIASLPNVPRGVRRDEIITRTSGRLQKDLLALFDTKAHEKRNLVVHKYAYRPTKIEAARVLVEARSTLYGLKHDLGPELEFEDYANAPPRVP